MKYTKYLVIFIGLAALIVYAVLLATAGRVSYNYGRLIISGKPRIIISGSIHYPRSTVDMWPDLIEKAKLGGLDAIDTYVFWDLHEPQRRQYDFSGNLNFTHFLRTVQATEMYAILRIGPYVSAERNYGGFPVWLHNLPGIELRTDNQVYKDEMQTFTSLIVNMCKKEKLFAQQGGPIILSQIENEYGSVEKDYGQAGKSYIDWCAEMAQSLKTGVPWIMSQQADAPRPMINTCNGFYCDAFEPNNPHYPKMWTENWTGRFKTWGAANAHRTAEDTAFAVARFFQAGGVVQNYYMYHGGTNFGRTAGGPYVTTSYDYDAPLDEYGNIIEPKYGHLRQLHDVLKQAEAVLTTRSWTNMNLGNGVTLTKFNDETGGGSFCFLSNINVTQDAKVHLKNAGRYELPAWSVSLLSNCKREIYNTAKIYSQTSVMVKKRDRPLFNWSWRAEPIKDTINGFGGTSNATQLLEQKSATADASDYLWYMTSIDIGKNDIPTGVQMTLRVNSNGHVLHAYVNKKLIGSQWSEGGKYHFVFEKPIKLKPGRNYITLLSATVGLQNHGAFFDRVPTGIVGGPVQLTGTGDVNITMDLSSNLWSYKVGLNGEMKKFYDPNSQFYSKWSKESFPKHRPMTWYKSTFTAPLGGDPVVVDLQGMGKGHAWVNGQSIGRFWPSFLATEDKCTAICDYRGEYKADKCLRNCGNPTQRWYHVPRSFLNDGDNNTLVLFEEIGGNPAEVHFQTVTVGKACNKLPESFTMDILCQGGNTISDIEFASFGDPQGSCESFVKGTCESANALSMVKKGCLGTQGCSLEVSEAQLGRSNCSEGTRNTLAVQAVC